VLTLIAFLVVISVLILVHEYGHFLAAKSVDIQVPRFSLGLGPRVAGFTIGETEYVLSAIPLGGYVKMAGMEDDEAAEALEGGGDPAMVDPERTFDSKPLWARAWVISAGVIFNMIFAVLVFIAIGLAYGETVNTERRLAIDPGSLPREAASLAQLPHGSRIAAVGDEPVESWDEFAMEVLRAPAGPVVLRFEGAPPATITLPAGDSARAALVRSLPPVVEPVIGRVIAGGPAERAGIRPGDRVAAAGGEPVRGWEEFVRAVEAHSGRPLPLELERAGRPVTLTVTPEPGGEGRKVGKIGAGPVEPGVHRSLGFGEAVAFGFQQTWATTELIVGVLGRLITGQESLRSLGGPLTIGQISGEAARLGLETFLGFMAMFSVNLAVFNLLPVPILDGGHLLFLAIEAVRGRALSLEYRIRLSQLGMIFVIALMVWALTNDVLRVIFKI
jgi:regulator of sigma E protease